MALERSTLLFLPDTPLTASVRAYDILNMKKNISRSVSASTIIDSEYNDLTRYVMFSLTWNFSTLKKKASAMMPEEFGMPGPPPGEGGGRPGERSGQVPPGPPPHGASGGHGGFRPPH